ncbi:MAG: glycerol-3-phosphate 1-O-acyltransferase PlsY [Candidatus Eisenbacteria bacterium]|jgi:glycerol-3-phosphate acyltransferase PlsY|nr:glycerol-3-phosphate 1-O-acyltransferase PlsY [Candidatus Eisenbacteria bacterium]
MPAILSLVAAMAAGYVSGSLPWGLWLGKWFKGVDVRTMGSGNLGATNVYRSLGPGIGVATLLLDIAKGAVPVFLVPAAPFAAAFPGGPEWCKVAVAFAAVAGHVWTFLAGFKGGKGVATTVGVLLALSPPSFGVFLAVFLVTLLATRFVSLGSMLGAVAFTIALWKFSPGGWSNPSVMLGALLAVVVIVRHKDNITRLLQGKENRFAFKRAKS